MIPRYGTMPICKSCGGKIPNLKVIDGVLKNLSKRRYCLACVPFKSRRGRQPVVCPGNRICEKCGRRYDYARNKGHRLLVCNSCARTKRRLTAKRKLIELKGGKCERCGYNKSLAALQFHHKDKTKKEFWIGGLNRSWKKTLAEVAKCELVCANCHFEIHSGPNSAS